MTRRGAKGGRISSAATRRGVDAAGGAVHSGAHAGVPRGREIAGNAAMIKRGKGAGLRYKIC